MHRPHATPRQIRDALIKCSAQLSNLLRRSAEGNPTPTSIARAHHAELNQIVVHAVMTLKRVGSDTALARSVIARTYAKGIDKRSSAPTVESVEFIREVLNAVVAAMDGKQHHDGQVL